MQKVMLGHDTPYRAFEVKSVSLGLGTMLQVDPFLCSISVLDVLDPTSPTAVHSVAVVQSTAKRVPCPLGVGPVINVHEEPVHCSMRGSVRPPTDWYPTPTQKAALTQE